MTTLKEDRKLRKAVVFEQRAKRLREDADTLILTAATLRAKVEINREPQPGDGPDYSADHASWVRSQTNNADHLERMGLR